MVEKICSLYNFVQSAVSCGQNVYVLKSKISMSVNKLSVGGGIMGVRMKAHVMMMIYIYMGDYMGNKVCCESVNY